MGFMHKISKASKFLNKGMNKAEHFGQKIIKGADKGLHIAGKVADIADKTLGALESVPVVGEVVAPGRALLKQGRKVLKGGEVGLDRVNEAMNKAHNKRLKLM